MTSSAISTLTRSILLMPSFVSSILHLSCFYSLSKRKARYRQANTYYRNYITHLNQWPGRVRVLIKKMKSILLMLQVDFICTICLSPQTRWMELPSDINKCMPHAGSKLIWQTNTMVTKCVYLDPLSLQGLR